MQHALAGLQGLDDLAAGNVDHLHRVVVGKREVDPDLPPVGARHDEYWLAVNGDAPDLLPAAVVHDEHLMPSDGGHQRLATRQRPALQVRHLVDRQLFLALAVVSKDAPDALFGIPQVQHGEAILAEEARHVIATVRGDEGIVGLAASVRVLGEDGLARVLEVRHPDLARLEEAEGEALLAHVDQADDL
ncbi:hypothetical protein D3C86_1494280 [compost metagenome]